MTIFTRIGIQDSDGDELVDGKWYWFLCNGYYEPFRVMDGSFILNGNPAIMAELKGGVFYKAVMPNDCCEGGPHWGHAYGCKKVPD